MPIISTRGVPPKLYDPEYEAHKLKYPMNKLNENCLSQVAKAYHVVYSKSIPTKVEEALKNKHWRRKLKPLIEIQPRIIHYSKRKETSWVQMGVHHKLQS